jgi:hypothetical protein
MSDNAENLTRAAETRAVSEDMMAVIEAHQAKPAAVTMAGVAIVLGALIRAAASPEAAYVNMIGLIRDMVRGGVDG